MGNHLHLMVGGQAVIEGVMMRGPKLTATAVRDPNGQIQVETKDVHSISDRYPILKKPLLRGSVSLVESLVIGIRSLSYSAKMAGEEDEQLTDREMAGTIVFALVLASILFIAIPTGAARLFHFITEDPFFLNLMEGFLRLAIFLGYIWGISRMKDIRRVFQYHGAEHKTIHCFENGLELTPENCRQFPTLHPRCGTSFLMFVFIIAFALHFLLGWPTLWLRIVTRLLLLPVIAGISYELLKWAGRSDNWVVKILSLPGLWLQMITTKEPDDSMLEVAIASINAVCDEREPGVRTIKSAKGAGYEYPPVWALPTRN